MAEEPYPHPHNGHRDALEEASTSMMPTVRVIAHAALYIGNILECICYEQWRQGSRRPGARWFPPKDYEDDD
jgi:hypothetical protein